MDTIFKYERKHKIKKVSWPDWEIRFSWENDVILHLWGLVKSLNGCIRLLMSRKFDSLFICEFFNDLFNIRYKGFWSIVCIIKFWLFLCMTLAIFRIEENFLFEKDIVKFHLIAKKSDFSVVLKSTGILFWTRCGNLEKIWKIFHFCQVELKKGICVFIR